MNNGKSKAVLIEKSSVKYQTYVKTLEKVLISESECTEPTAIALCAAKISTAVYAGIFG